MTRENQIYYGWIVVAACFIGTMVVYGISYSFGIFFDPLLAEFNASRGRTSLVFSLHTFMLYIGAVVVGRLIDTYGVRRLLFLGTLLFGLGLLWTSRVQSLTELIIAYSIIASIGLSIIYVVSYATVPRWFTERRGFAGGVASSGLGVGMLLISPGAEYLIDYADWQTAYAIICAFLVTTLLIATVLIRDPPTHEPTADRPACTPNTSRNETSTLDAITALASKQSFQLLFLGWILIYTTLYVVFVNLPVYTADQGLTTQVGAFALGIIGATSVLSRLTVGFAADYIGRTTMFTISSAIMGVSTLFFPFVETAPVLYLIAICYGLGYGGNGALLSPLMADFYGTANINTVFGLISISFAISGLFTPYLAGNIYDFTGTYTIPFLASGLLAIGGAGLIATAKRITST